jgi:hypothetical protein
MSRTVIDERLRGYALVEDRQNDCLVGIHEWLGTLCSLFYRTLQSKELPVRQMTQNDSFALTVIYMQHLAHEWGSEAPSSDWLACIQVMVDLLLRVEANKEKFQSDVKSEFVACYLLSCALLNEVTGEAEQLLSSTEKADVEILDSRYDLPALVGRSELSGGVQEVQRQFHS